ncbi:hypothetical protein EIK77_010208 [Talaromyces pinophilus]|jgi:hypothetical protein|nr:hypothetical protein EIK77_010208 [Talaromyces pinophilus]PCH01470.1 SMP-30/Gluconolaconase/LRE-like region [Penicillium occitanis (nom. inval.)]PCH02068.1 hypothetical protein PENOC_045470 [Penicillium occitanis (nom. inval.)]
MPHNARLAGELVPRIVFWGLVALIISIVYQNFLSNILFVVFGIGRRIQTIDEFPWTCTRLYHPLLEGCEDMWLDHQGRKLYGACTTLTSRQGWNPSGNKYNISARSRTDHLAVLDIDHPGSDGLYGLRALELGGFHGDLDLQGFDVQRIGDTLRFWLINHRPPIDHLTGAFLDPTTVGANSTIEVFDLVEGSEALEYVKTIHSNAIISPNSLAVDKDGTGVVITNDHNAKVGAFRDLEILYRSGTLAYCQLDSGECHMAATKGLAFPNGITSDQNGLFYVAHSLTGAVTVHRLQDGQLIQIDSIPLGYPIDNISLDADGNLIAAALPDLIGFVKASEDPYNAVAPATVLSIEGIVGQVRSRGRDYNISKVVEDSDAKVLPGISTALHDVESQRLFLGGVFSPFIGICERIAR